MAKRRHLKHSDAGGIYERAAPGGKGFGGFPPKTNASRSPGEWQFYRVWFRAPRFDSSGKKTGNALFESVLYNGVAVHQNVSCDGPTRSSLELPEARLNPMMLQGDHGPVAYRNIHFRPLPARS
ncbi:MAG: family 16 glycoside hydrolase [Bryobacteraceae bacterium]